MLIACDLDRTLIPNGEEVDDKSLPLFFDLIKAGGHTLVYVSGRSLALVREAQKEYALAMPDFLLGDVGTTMYRKNKEGELVKDEGWAEYVKEKTPRWSWKNIVAHIGENEHLHLQEPEKQNPFKLSFYLDLLAADVRAAELARIEQILAEMNVSARVIYSVDQIKKVGLVDVLPAAATKIQALLYLAGKIGVPDEKIIYAGDSGNDILPLTHGFRAIVVKNAREEVKREVTRITKEKGITDKVYIAKGTERLNGNYSSGVLEGLIHFGVFSHTPLSSENNVKSKA